MALFQHCCCTISTIFEAHLLCLVKLFFIHRLPFEKERFPCFFLVLHFPCYSGVITGYTMVFSIHVIGATITNCSMINYYRSAASLLLVKYGIGYGYPTYHRYTLTVKDTCKIVFVYIMVVSGTTVDIGHGYSIEGTKLEPGGSGKNVGIVGKKEELRGEENDRLNKREKHDRMTDVILNGLRIRTNKLITFYICRFLAKIIQPVVNRIESNAKNYYYFLPNLTRSGADINLLLLLFTVLFTTVHRLFTTIINRLAMVPCGRKVTLPTLLLILFLNQAVVSQGHKELWGEL